MTTESTPDATPADSVPDAAAQAAAGADASTAAADGTATPGANGAAARRIYREDGWNGKRPDDVPEPYWKDGGIDVAAALKSASDSKRELLAARQEMNAIKEKITAATPPETYTYTPPETLAGVLPADAGNPLIAATIEAVRKHGGSQALLDDVITTVGTVLASPEIQEHEVKRLAKGRGVTPQQIEEELQAIKPRQQAIAQQFKSAVGTAAEVNEMLELLTSSAVGVELFQAAIDGSLHRLAGSYAHVPTGGAASGAGATPTRDDLVKLKLSTEYQRGDKAARQAAADMLAKIAAAEGAAA